MADRLMTDEELAKATQVPVPMTGWRVPDAEELEFLSEVPEGTERYCVDSDDGSVVFMVMKAPGKPAAAAALLLEHGKSFEIPERVANEFLSWARPPPFVDTMGHGWLDGLRRVHVSKETLHKWSASPRLMATAVARYAVWTDGNRILMGLTEERLTAAPPSVAKLASAALAQTSFRFATKESLLAYAKGFTHGCRIDDVLFGPALLADSIERLDGPMVRVAKAEYAQPLTLRGNSRVAVVMPLAGQPDLVAPFRGWVTP